MCVFGICMSAHVCGQVKMFIHVQTLKVAKGRKRGEAFVHLTHLPRLCGFVVVVTAGEINLAETSLNSFVRFFYLESQNICTFTKQFTVVQQGTHRDVTVDSFMLESNTAYTERQISYSYILMHIVKCGRL